MRMDVYGGCDIGTLKANFFPVKIPTGLNVDVTACVFRE